MESTMDLRAKKPLGKSITIGCVIFIITMCIIIGLITYFGFKRALYYRYEAYIDDVLTYVDDHIDDDDLKNCMNTLERSEKYDELELFMDKIKEDFDIHYLYILTPLNTEETGNMLVLLSAESYYDRYIDTEGNLYLGWISDDEYDSKTAAAFFDIMKTDKVVFFEEKTEWSTDYTGALTLHDSTGEAYAILCVDIDITEIHSLIGRRTLDLFLSILFLGALFTALFLLWAKKNITEPISALEQGVVDFAKRSHGQHDLNALKFNAPDIHTQNEVKSLATAVTQMSVDMHDYVVEILSAEKEAREMKMQADRFNELANRDALTGIRNKTAYNREIESMDWNLKTGMLENFGIAMIDLNFLKKINDSFGHEKGDLAIQKLSRIICTIFAHSPVFRIGGDEFVVILKGSDYTHSKEL
ncbi:MAG: GGDEF domain-containing protein, partial [Butyrivibrio sp.]|nr:GGDEF domain-containing protein [Butyrivibrio sp.]